MRSAFGTLADGLRTLVNRAPVAYTSDRSNLGLGRLLLGTSAEAQMSAMGAVGTLFNIVNTTSTAVSSVEWHLHRRTRRSPGSADARRCEECEEPGYTLVEDHQALRLWNTPNDFWTGAEWREAGQQHVDLVGEGWTVVERNDMGGSIPLGLWPVRPDRIFPVPSENDFIAGYIYVGPSGERVPLAVDEVLPIKMPNPIDPYRGMGPVQSIMVNLDSKRFSAEWNRKFFLNDATPGGLIQFPGAKDGGGWIDDTNYRRFIQRWRESHKGINNAHRVGVLENGAQWVDRQYSQRDMQFAELDQVSADSIREAFGFPKFAAGIVQDINRATAEASMAWFGKQITVPRLERWKTMANARFLPLFGTAGQGLEFAYCSPVPEDQEAENAERTSKAQAFKMLIDAGMNAEDAAMICGYPEGLRVEKPQVVVQQPPPGAGDQNQQNTPNQGGTNGS